jgi:formamidopyrimidine-DNA glycosylase
MPELPDIEFVRKLLQTHCVGHEVKQIVPGDGSGSYPSVAAKSFAKRFAKIPNDLSTETLDEKIFEVGLSELQQLEGMILQGLNNFC